MTFGDKSLSDQTPIDLEKVVSKVLITGAAGFLGHHLTQRLLIDGHEVICIDNFLRGENDTEIQSMRRNPHVEWWDLDLCQPDSLAKETQSIDEIYHLAALNGTQNFYSNPYTVLKNCSLPTINVLDFAKKVGCGKVFLAGSSESYADLNSKLGTTPTPETVPVGVLSLLNPRWSYSISKTFSEMSVISSGYENGTIWTIGRLHNIYGPRMGDKHFIPDFIERMKRGVFELYGGNQTRSFLYVSDAINQIIKIMASNQTNEKIVNIGSTNEVQILFVSGLMMEICGKTGDIRDYGPPKGSVDRRVPDMSLSKSLIGENERVTLREGLTKTIEWYAPELLDK